MKLQLESVTRRFGHRTVVDQVSLDIMSGQLVGVLGPSGSGKTTLLRLIAGLETSYEGRILFDGLDASQLSLQARGVGLVFQQYALFRHMRVFENVAFGLRARSGKSRLSSVEIRRRVNELIHLVQLEGFEDRFPGQLSGGQKQRVALARALAVEPRLLLLDEPFGALDAMVRRDLRRWLRSVHERTGRTTIFVTHDQEEALELADRVIVMNAGRVEQDADPDRIYDDPASSFVFEFIGEASRVPVQIRDGLVWFRDRKLISPRVEAPDGPAVLHLRPEHVRRVEGEGSIDVSVVAGRRIGPRRRLGLEIRGGFGRLEMDADAAAPIRIGDQFRVEITGGRVYAPSQLRPPQ
ncbi:MAG: sulfate/molybdate ABC transporter ATP-binding protein [Alphaproteobacteria bacterium]|nr:sulfate/molybdate ABC transporter ATP-binding protein [Alphaproteobacteria bacterium]